eukprot:TRINITY_DN4465_c0_g1_i2.p1 TRINITY_DN4465_c0_g1~~TRINITY_DN4465_c0_g1_i2.p1  ORF type:complete len:566 (-),score=93.94 TRINITY_DN4465_c0_g1_i2:60-1757(-)
MKKEDTIVIFDLNTIADPGQNVPLDTLHLLNRLRQKTAIAIISASPLETITRTLDPTWIEEFDYVFSENGLITYKKSALFSEKLITQAYNEDEIQEIINFSLDYLAKLKLPFKRGSFVDFRKGLIAFSPAGGKLKPEEENLWIAFDKENGVLRKMGSALRERFSYLKPPLDFALNGNREVEIFPQGWDKSICLESLKDHKTIYFVGHLTETPNESDYSLCASERTFAYHVDSPDQTRDLVKNLFLDELTARYPTPLLTLTIGYLLEPKKLKTFHGALQVFRTNGQRMVKLEVDGLANAEEVDIIIHKARRTNETDEETLEQPPLLKAYLKAHPKTFLLDSFRGVGILTFRHFTAKALRNLLVKNETSGESIRIPRSVIVEAETVELPDFPFPGVAKPFAADGTEESHDLALVYSNKGLNALKKPFLLEQFLNHDSVLFKIYAIGPHLDSSFRNSLPNLSPQQLESLAEKGFDFFPRISRGEPVPMDQVRFPSQEVLHQLCNKLNEILDLSLFGADLIRETGTNNIYLLDVNYFPSYSGFASRYHKLLDHVLAKWRAAQTPTSNTK